MIGRGRRDPQAIGWMIYVKVIISWSVGVGFSIESTIVDLVNVQTNPNHEGPQTNIGRSSVDLNIWSFFKRLIVGLYLSQTDINQTFS